MIKVYIYMTDGTHHEIDCDHTAFADAESLWFACFVEDQFPIFMIPKENISFILQEDTEDPEVAVSVSHEKVH